MPTATRGRDRDPATEEKNVPRRRMMAWLAGVGLAGSGVLAALSNWFFFKPRVTYGPSARFAIGKPEDFPPGTRISRDVERVCIVREGSRLAAISTSCTHLGCIAALDPGPNSSRLELERFSLTGPYIRGHFRGDRVSVAIRPENVRVHSGDAEARADLIGVELLRASHRWRWVRPEFSHGIFADLPCDEFARRKDNKNWKVEFHPRRCASFDVLF